MTARMPPCSGAALLSSINSQLGNVGYVITVEYGFYIFFTLCLLCIVAVLAARRRAGARRRPIYRVLQSQLTRSLELSDKFPKFIEGQFTDER